MEHNIPYSKENAIKLISDIKDPDKSVSAVKTLKKWIENCDFDVNNLQELRDCLAAAGERMMALEAESKDLLRQNPEGAYKNQLESIAKVFNLATLQSNACHFTESQNRDIEQWKLELEAFMTSQNLAQASVSESVNNVGNAGSSESLGDIMEDIRRCLDQNDLLLKLLNLQCRK